MLQHLQGVLAASPKPELQKLGAKLALKPEGEGATNGGTEAPASGAEAPTDEAVELAAASRAPIWPRAWRVQPAPAEPSVLALLAAAEAPVFGGGGVETTLLLVDDEEHPSKRARSEEHDADGLPPPVRGGRGRVREDNPPLRGKPNTSRPASKHVDDFMPPGGGGPKRFANSSRAPSKHVDEYQPAPVVRKTVRPAAHSTATTPLPRHPPPCHALPPPLGVPTAPVTHARPCPHPALALALSCPATALSVPRHHLPPLRRSPPRGGQATTSRLPPTSRRPPSATRPAMAAGRAGPAARGLAAAGRAATAA